MNKDILSRYETDSNGKILIDVAASKVEDLYNNFDRSAPYIRRDLDQELVDYLIESAKELENEQFTVCFTLTNPPNEASLSRIRHSVNSFFLSLAGVERNKVRQMLRRSIVLFAIGIALLFVSVWVNQRIGLERRVVTNVFAQGLTVAAWVSLWESLATFLVDWFPLRSNIKLYRRLASIQPVFRSTIDGQQVFLSKDS